LKRKSSSSLGFVKMTPRLIWLELVSCFLILCACFVYFTKSFLGREVSGTILCVLSILYLFFVPPITLFESESILLKLMVALFAGLLGLLVGFLLIFFTKFDYPLSTLSMVLFVPGIVALFLVRLKESE